MEEEFVIVPSGAPDSYCRLCLSEANVEPLLLAANQLLQPKHALLQLIKRYMEIDLLTLVDSPCGICSTCRLLLEEFENFRERCLRCDFVLNGKQKDDIQNGSDLPFQCSKCPIKFRFKSEYEKHWKSSHDLPHHCDRCDAQFSMLSLLKFHQFRYHGNPSVGSLNVSCTLCPRVFVDDKQLQFHTQLLHNRAATEEEFAPPKKKRKLNKSVKHKQDGQSKKPLECEVCKAQYYFIGSLRRHLSDGHGIMLRAPIGTDQQKGATADRVEIRQPEIAVITANSSAPVIVPPPVIPRTSENPEIKSELPDDVSTTCRTVVPDYDQKPLMDDLSQMLISKIEKDEAIVSSEIPQYQVLSPFVIAIERLDPNLAPPVLNYEIPLGRIFYAQQQQLPELNTTDQLDQEIAMNYPSYTQQVRKLFVCVICQQKFTNSGSLNLHTQFVHHGIAYQCTECGKQFALRSRLERHAYVHRSEYPYRCDECPMMFIQQYTMRKHKTKYHVPGAPAQVIRFCPYCNRAFNTKNSLRGHMALIHRKPYTGDAHEQAAAMEM
ncbi:zinc finger protein 189-like [Armigeres subalbatus]|uniref:zinc finger protein 189-like n=1 Tax=Armigeres subalbatus TaxID=124917 RepID=UPI002ED2ADD5